MPGLHESHDPVLRAADHLARAVADLLESGAGDGIEHVSVPVSQALALYHSTRVMHYRGDREGDAPSMPEQQRAARRLGELGWFCD